MNDKTRDVLSFRPACASDYSALEPMVIDSFGPITWMRTADARFGPLNGKDWRARWETRFRRVFDTQHVLVGEANGRIVACATGTYDCDTRLGYIDLLAVDGTAQGCGYGREMLRGMIAHFKQMGAEHVHLECLQDNQVGNCLYRSEGFEEVARSVRWFKKI